MPCSLVSEHPLCLLDAASLLIASLSIQWKVRVRSLEIRQFLRVRALVLTLCMVSGLFVGKKAIAQSGLQVSFGASGLQSLTYNNVVLESLSAYPSDAFHIWHMKATDLSGNLLSAGQYTWGEVNNGRSWDSSAHTWTYNFVWGSIRLQYVQNGNNLDLITTTVNNAGSGIIFDGASLYPLALNFPQLPAGFPGSGSPSFADNTSAPSVTVADYGAGEVSAMVPDASKALYSGYQTTGTGFGYTALISSTSPDSLASFLPHNDRPVNPGETDTFTVSLRFAASGTSASSLAADVYKSWAQTYPPVLNWNDRRVIGTVYLASSPTGPITQPGGFPNNPRRYFSDSNSNDFDVTTTAGLAAFQARILAQAQSNVTNLKLLNAQGAITWDIEGEQYPQDTSYVCSPDQIATVAPEMESVVTDRSSPYFGMKLDDAYFKTMTDAGFRVGVCVRPQQFGINPDGTAQQTTLDTSLVAAQLIRKLKYAHDRWGATLFYIDSTVDSLGGTLDASIFQLAAAALPDSLLIPEESTPRHYAYVAPFKSFIFHGDLGTDSTVYNYYPNAFSANLVNDVDPGVLSAAQAQLTQQVKQGDILMAHADYWQANNPVIVQIYQNAGTWTNPTGSAVTPTALGLSTSASSTTFGTSVALTAALAPSRATGTVTFYDGATALGTVSANSGVASLSTTVLAVGTHTLTAVYAGSTSYAASTSGAVTVVVLAATTNTTLTASTSSVLQGMSETFTASVSGSGTGILPSGTVTFLDGPVALGTTTLNSGIATLNTAAMAAGVHSIQAIYAGATGLASSSSPIVHVTVTAPLATTLSLSLSSPSVTAGSALTISGRLTPAATGVVTFYDGTAALGTAAVNAGVASLTISTLSAGAHTLTAVYSGSTIYAASTSSPATATVTPVQATTNAVTTNLLIDPGFELQPTSQPTGAWSAIGSSAIGVDRNLGNAHSGANNSYIWDDSNSWNMIAQIVAVQPNTEYVFSAWVRTSLVGQAGYLSVDGQNAILNETSFGNLPQYTLLVVKFNSGANTSVRVRVGFWGQNTVQWIQADDFALRQNLLSDPGFELQASSSISSPWTVIGTSALGVDRNLGNAHTGANNGYIWDQSSSWNAIAQTVAVQPNTNYVLTGWIKSSLVANVGYFSVDGATSILNEVSFGDLPGYSLLTVTFNSGANTSVRIRAGFWGQNSAQWIQLDDVTLQQTQ